jgi:hypothetical protein
MIVHSCTIRNTSTYVCPTCHQGTCPPIIHSDAWQKHGYVWCCSCAAEFVVDLGAVTAWYHVPGMAVKISYTFDPRPLVVELPDKKSRFLGWAKGVKRITRIGWKWGKRKPGQQD